MNWKIATAVTSTLLTVALVLLAREMFRYEYLQQGQNQYRIERWSKETDRLTPVGWKVVQIERTPSTELTKPELASESWNGFSNEICATVSNPDGQVLKSVIAIVTVTGAANAEAGEWLEMKGPGLVAPSEKSIICGTPKVRYPTDSKFTLFVVITNGWKE
jgi:hypothetical protein